GLATVYGIVETHGGAIEVLDNEPRGAILRIRFPGIPARPRAAPAPRPEKRIHQGRGTVLLVEDEEHVRVASARSLSSIGYEVVPASDGVEALEIYRARGPEIAAVVLDMVMPRLSGRDTYLALRNLDPAVRVVLTTGFALNEEAQEILDLGVREFVPKPYDLESLSEALARVSS